MACGGTRGDRRRRPARTPVGPRTGRGNVRARGLGCNPTGQRTRFEPANGEDWRPERPRRRVPELGHEGLNPASASAGRGDKSVEAFRNALERSLVLSRERLQEAVDDAVKRGRMTQSDANELVSRLVTRGRQQTDDLMKELERLLEQARTEVESRVGPARKRAERRRRGASAPAMPRIRRARGGRQAAPPRRRRPRPDHRLRQPDRHPGQGPSEGPESRRSAEGPHPGEAGKARKSVLADIEKRLGASNNCEAEAEGCPGC